jgi:hypothetical protein
LGALGLTSASSSPPLAGVWCVIGRLVNKKPDIRQALVIARSMIYMGKLTEAFAVT